MGHQRTRGKRLSRRLRRRRGLAHHYHQGGYQRRLFQEQLEDRRLLSATAGDQAIELFSVSTALFVENQGQWEDESVRYAFQGSGANVLHTDHGPVFELFQREAVQEQAEPDAGPAAQLPEVPWDDEQDYVTEMTTFSAHFDGANLIEPVGQDQAETLHNYFVGDEANWRSEVPTFATVAYPELYDGIDLLTWGRRDSLKYEFHVAPGADWTEIQISYEGIDGLWLDDEGVLHVETELGGLVDDAPYIYQEIDGEQVAVSGSFKVIDSDSYTFDITGSYDPTVELVIDPELAWATYLGGSGDDGIGIGLAVDSAGNVYVTGRTESSGWATSGAYDEVYNGDSDAFVAKLNPSGSDLLYMTYLGGSGDETPWDIAVDSIGNAYVTGYTYSSGWATSGAHDESHNGSNALQLIEVINNTGVRELSETRDEGVVKPFLDVTHDNFLTALDVLWVVNFLNQQAAAGAGEGEGESNMPAAVIDPLIRNSTSRLDRPEGVNLTAATITDSPAINNTPYWQQVDETFSRLGRRGSSFDTAQPDDEQLDWWEFLDEEMAPSAG